MRIHPFLLLIHTPWLANIHTGSHWIIDAETGNSSLYPLSLWLWPCTKSISTAAGNQQTSLEMHECSLNSKGPLGPLSIVPTWWVAPVPARTNRTLVSRRANQRAVEAQALSYHRCEVSGCVHKWLLLCGQEGLVPFHDHWRELTLRLLSSVLFWCQIELKTLLSCLFARR